jgi:hypothetical protein
MGRQIRQGQQLRIDIGLQMGRQIIQGQHLIKDCRWEDRLVRATADNRYRTADRKTD